jgi:hypothetical protein
MKSFLIWEYYTYDGDYARGEVLRVDNLKGLTYPYTFEIITFLELNFLEVTQPFHCVKMKQKFCLIRPNTYIWGHA